MRALEYCTWFNTNLGLIHTLFAVLAMLLGSIVLLNAKGIRLHKRIGYAYFASMLLLNLTSFGLHTFGSFGPFHFAATMSLFTIIGGIIPAIRKRNERWIIQHYYFMSGSVVGLYAAFWAEVGTRLFDINDAQYFWWVVIIASAGTIAIGVVIMKKEAKLFFQEKTTSSS